MLELSIRLLVYYLKTHCIPVRERSLREDKALAQFISWFSNAVLFVSEVWVYHRLVH